MQLTIRGTTTNLADHEVYEGLRKLWQARRAGDRTAKIEESDGDAASSAVTLQMLLEYIDRHEKVLASDGIELGPPVYAPGSVVLSVGDAAFKVERSSWEESVEISDQLQALWRLIRREERHVTDVALRDVKMTSSGALDWGEGPIYAEKTALKQLLKLAGCFGGGVSYVVGAPPDLRAHNWNSQVHGSVHSSRQARLRLRRNPVTGRFSVFAVVTPKYGVLDIDGLASTLADSMPTTGMRGIVFYDSASTNLRIEGHWEQQYVVDRPSQDIFRCGVQIRSNDTGNGGIWVLPAAMRVLTSAQVLLGRAGRSNETLYHTIHQGNMGRVAEGITGALARAGDDFGNFESTWRSVRALGRPYGLGGGTDEEALVYIQHMFMRKLDLGMSKEDVEAQLLAFHRIEPVGRAADLVNAVGRLHALPQINQYQREKLEEITMDIIDFFSGKENSR